MIYLYMVKNGVYPAIEITFYTTYTQYKEVDEGLGSCIVKCKNMFYLQTCPEILGGKTRLGGETYISQTLMLGQSLPECFSEKVLRKWSKTYSYKDFV